MEILLNDWLSHPEYWFSPTHAYDTYITNTYKHLFDTAHTQPASLALIILYDQVARHVYRDDPKAIDHHLTNALLVRQELPPPEDATEWVFYQLPIRHQNIPKHVMQVIQEAWSKLKRETDSAQISILTQFIRASYQRLTYDPSLITLTTQIPIRFSDFTDYVDILEFCPLEFQGNNRKSLLYQIFEEYMKKHSFTKIIMSVSGGVDSQVCLYVLKLLQDRYKYDLVALHINYTNRTTKEADFVIDWCRFLDVPCYIRHLNEIQRKPCMEFNLRETYETYTRNVRFNAYKYIQGDVFLGHNEDDCFENILTNIAHKNKYDNLRGMEETQTLDDITFHRPILRIPKHSIYEYAHHVGIPYLQDSTPAWSQRGRIRDKVRPALEEWDSSIVDAFFDLSDVIQEYDALANAYLTNITREIIKSDDTYTITFPSKTLTQCKRLWSKIFDHLDIHCSHKSMNNFMEIIQKNQNNKININKNITIHQSDNTFVIKPNPSSPSSE